MNLNIKSYAFSISLMALISISALANERQTDFKSSENHTYVNCCTSAGDCRTQKDSFKAVWIMGGEKQKIDKEQISDIKVLKQYKATYGLEEVTEYLAQVELKFDSGSDSVDYSETILCSRVISPLAR